MADNGRNAAPSFLQANSPGSTAAERARATRWTLELVSLLPNLEIVLLFGAAARDGWERVAPKLERSRAARCVD